MNRIRNVFRKLTTKRRLLRGGIVLGGLCVAVQLAYPQDTTVLFARADGQSVGGITVVSATELLHTSYESHTIPIYFGDNDTAYRSPTVASIGGEVDSTEAAEQLRYPWWLRIVPTSLLWATWVVGNQESTVAINEQTLSAYVEKELGDSCQVAPKNATIDASGNSLVVIPASNGGTCELSDVTAALKSVNTSPATNSSVRIAMDEIPPEITDAAAEQLRTQIEHRLETPVVIAAGDEMIEIPAATVRTWLEFSSENGALRTLVSPERAADELEKTVGQKVAIKAGTVTITTHDFTETARTGGSEGRALDIIGTADNIAAYLVGTVDAVTAKTVIVEPKKQYIRTYSASNTGLSALIKNYAEEHSGVYGVSLVELSRSRRNAGFDENKKFTTASTYKLFVAYSTLKRIESGELSWSDQIVDGRNLQKCFDDMIVLSDNPCAESLVQKIGYRPLTNDAAAIGATNTSFVDIESYKTTARDLSLLLAQLESNQLPINATNRNILISALKRNVYRQGIPSGASGTVADKVGFLDGFLHDAAIVYAPSGTYVLTIMTDGSSWAQIAELTKQIESLRSR